MRPSQVFNHLIRIFNFYGSTLLVVCLALACGFYSCKGTSSNTVTSANSLKNTKDQPLPSVPDPDRFQKIELVSNLNEPMELQVLPDGNVLFIERGGSVKLFDTKEDMTHVLANLPVFNGIEDGLLGLALDPDFVQNHFVYFFYSPSSAKEVQRVARFVLTGSTLDLKSEKILLEIPVQRKECCHSAGSLAFGPDKTLYIAVGDNTNPHNPGYYNSTDERAGREFWDAQRTASNTNDLRGKVLRIKPEPDGTYSIPKGNLFLENSPKTRPEIYAMGARNPYRITVNPKTGWLYWGDVGQNTIDNPTRGPISYDEWHQAKKPGFFGWPYFAGNNKPYARFNFVTDSIGPFYEPLKPVNHSKNNTGLQNLPPAESALIWYSYDESKEFKNLGTGGKSPIAGPFYYADLYQQQPAWVKSPRKFPDYYTGKWFIAEWMRDWINVVTLDENGKLRNIEPFMPGVKFDHPIDLEFGPDGALYVLEYGTGWFAHNQNARLVRIDYIEGNRPPIAKLQASKTAGAVPFTVSFSAAKSFDYDKTDKLTYTWQLVNPEKQFPPGVESSYQFDQPGNYLMRLTVTDNHGLSASQEVEIVAGNERPDVSINFTGNKTFFWPQLPINYQIQVKDKEDGSLPSGQIKPQAVLVTADLADMGSDLTLLAQNQGKSTLLYLHPGQNLIKQSDCLACHQEEKKSIGPSWQQVAARYKKEDKVVTTLAQKVIRGGAGNWGQAAMSAHPQLNQEEAAEMVKFILTISEKKAASNQLPVRGTFKPASKADGIYIFRAMYQDQGSGKTPPLVGQVSHVLRPARVNAIQSDDAYGAIRFNNNYIRFPSINSYIIFQDLDLTGIRAVKLAFASTMPLRISLRVDNPEGPEIGAIDLPATEAAQSEITHVVTNWKEQEVKIKPLTGKKKLYVVATNVPTNLKGNNFLSLNWLYFQSTELPK